MKVISPENLPKFILDKRGHRTQEEFAADFGVSKQAVTQWETGKTVPGPDALKKLGLSKVYQVIA